MAGRDRFYIHCMYVDTIPYTLLFWFFHTRANQFPFEILSGAECKILLTPSHFFLPTPLPHIYFSPNPSHISIFVWPHISPGPPHIFFIRLHSITPPPAIFRDETESNFLCVFKEQSPRFGSGLPQTRGCSPGSTQGPRPTNREPPLPVKNDSSL